MWNIIGHEWAVELLESSAASGSISHAYLITGPPKVGKATLALAWAKVLNCQSEVPPCGHCRSCRMIDLGTHPDVRVVSGEKESLKIGQIRNLRREASLSPVEGRYRIHILTEMHRATVEAANCLLKTLEEPPSAEVLVLTATDTDQLLPTIISRCQVLRLRPVPRATIRDALMAQSGAEPQWADWLSRLAGGRIGWALAASQSPQILLDRERHLETLDEALSANRVKRWQCARDLSKKPEGLQPLLSVWAGWWLDVLRTRAGRAAPPGNAGGQWNMDAVAETFSMAEIRGALQSIQHTMQQLDRNANPLLALEVLLMDLPNAVLRAA